MPTRYTSEISHRAIDAASVLANSELLHFPPSSGAHVLCSAGKTGIATATSGWHDQQQHELHVEALCPYAPNCAKFNLSDCLT